MRLGRLERLLSAGLALVCGLFSAGAIEAGGWVFTDVTAYSEFSYTHGYNAVSMTERMIIAGGVAAGDYDRDGWVDLFIIQGDIGPNLLYRNLGIGKFREVGADAGVAGPAMEMNCGAIFADIDSDGWLDLVVGGVEDVPPTIFRNNRDGTFDDISATAGFTYPEDQFSFAMADFDGDFDLDMAVAHWSPTQDFIPVVEGGLENPLLTLWTNDGSGAFTDHTVAAEIDHLVTFAFTPIFADITDDGWLDLVVASDFGTSVVLFNDGDGTFTQNFASPITDENGMGASVGDYDNDGILDWVVTSIWDPDQTPEGNWGVTGNRLYRGVGSGIFQDTTDIGGVREGYWGWASCFADFDNDGNLDIFHVNGFSHISSQEFHNDPARMFINQGNGTFAERSAELQIDDTGQGRGVICFDYDRDGDVDVFIANNSQPPKMYRNDGGNDNNFLTLRLEGNAPNFEAIGARIYVTVGGTTQMREMRAGSNFASSDPVEAHFGLGTATVVDSLRIEWPGGSTTTLTDVPAGHHGTISEAGGNPPGIPDGSTNAVPMTVDKLDPAGNSLSLAWDMSGCSDAADTRILYGGGALLPALPGGVYGLDGSSCSIGAVSPYVWNGTPDPTLDPRGLVWWILAATDGGTVEGSWGNDSGGIERDGAGPDGSSGTCGVSAKSLVNGCGH